MKPAAQFEAPIERIRQNLIGLRMPRALEALDAVVQQIERGHISPIETIDTLLAEEFTVREGRRIKAALQMARLTAIKTLTGFDFSFQPSLDRNPQGEHALTGAERQARYRARQQAAFRYKRPSDRRTRPQRWKAAVAELIALQAEYAAWADAIPDGLRDTATAEALQAIVELDLEALADIEPPRGYGRD